MIWSRFLATLSQPSIPVQAKNVSILQTPAQFYNTLQTMIERAKRRIFISSLYFGSSENELLKILYNSLARNPRLNIYISLDLLRSTRPGLTSSASLLSPLVSAFPGRVHVHLFKSPTLKGLLSFIVPRRFDEGWGTWHAKVYGVDDEVLLSGANLNSSYFTNRQDRYLHFSASPVLSDYCFNFMKIFSAVSYKLTPESVGSASVALRWRNPKVEPKSLGAATKASIEQFQASYKKFSPRSHADAFVIPMIQAGYMNVREEEKCLFSLFGYLAKLENAKASIVDLTSGYFALHGPYQQCLIDSPVQTRIIAAGPKANGFYGSKGVSGRIPEAYTFLERQFWERVMQATRERSSHPQIELNEWEKDNWTYHAKGAWFRSPLHSTPNFTLFGSTNLNSRSANLDTELSFFMVTSNTSLQEQLQNEVELLRQHSHKVNEEHWTTPERRVRIGTRLLMAAGVQKML